MKKVLIANTNFETELAAPSPLTLLECLRSNPLYLQLQFLPLLTASSDDCLALTDRPSEAFIRSLENKPWRKEEPLPQMILISEGREFQGYHCYSWGATKQVEKWATERKMAYFMPCDWKMIEEINSKAFSHAISPVERAALIMNEEELAKWLSYTPGGKVLKTCFGLSGLGNRFTQQISPSPSLLSFCRIEWARGRPIIAEPRLERCLDFSTQWFIHPTGKIELVGPTVFKTDEKGAYEGTLAGPPEKLFGSYLSFLEEHIEQAGPLLKLLATKGYFGPLGLDAFLYRLAGSQKIVLRPLVEINARETMSLVALRLQQKWFEEQKLSLMLAPLSDPRPSLLPLELMMEERLQIFKKKLILSC